MAMNLSINTSGLPTPLQTATQFQDLNQEQVMAISGQLLQAFAALLTQDDEKEIKKNSNPARAYLMSSGVFMIKPLDQSVKVNPGNDSEYWSALGYDA